MLDEENPKSENYIDEMQKVHRLARLVSQQGQRVKVFNDINQKKQNYYAESLQTNQVMTHCTSKP